MSGTYYCTLTVPNAGQHTGAVIPTQNMICSTTQPVVNVTKVSHPVPDPVWLDLIIITAAVIIVITVAIWRHAVVTSTSYRTRKQRQMDHEAHMADLEVKRQQAIAIQLYGGVGR